MGVKVCNCLLCAHMNIWVCTFGPFFLMFIFKRVWVGRVDASAVQMNALLIPVSPPQSLSSQHCQHAGSWTDWTGRTIRPMNSGGGSLLGQWTKTKSAGYFLVGTLIVFTISDWLSDCLSYVDLTGCWLSVCLSVTKLFCMCLSVTKLFCILMWRQIDGQNTYLTR